MGIYLLPSAYDSEYLSSTHHYYDSRCGLSMAWTSLGDLPIYIPMDYLFGMAITQKIRAERAVPEDCDPEVIKLLGGGIR